MKTDDLFNLIRNGENSGLEFKRDSLRPEQLAKEIVAMANLQGGQILLGVEDNGSISGIQRKDLSEWLVDTVFGRYVHPMILPFYEEVQVEEGKRVAVVSFPQGVSKPYVVRKKDREDIYIRVGSSSRLATREQQMRLFETGGILHSEVMPVPGSSFESLDKVRLENYLRDILKDPDVPSSDTEWLERLEGLGLMVRNRDQEFLCTIAGLVLFGVKPRRYLKQSGLRVMVFKGAEKEYQALMDRVLDGPMVGRWQFGKEGKQLIDEGLIEKCVNSLGPFISSESPTIDRYFRRDKTWRYPLDAVRETMINALAHRDWTRFVDIEISVYGNRLEVISPGPLQNAMTIEKMKAGQRSTRNQIIVDILKDYGYVDARGMGIRTKVIPLMRAGGKEPVFKATEDYLLTVLLDAQKTQQSYPVDQVQEPSIETVAPINLVEQTGLSFNRSYKRSITPMNDLIKFIRLYPDANYDQMAQALMVSPATVKRNIQKLKKANRLKRVGSKKTGYWEAG
ncbi:MAG: transcriptional regulator [Deltaproteobacteria bacterium]|jgi:ATP-dependent DNA helicase RecG|nr:transcriptional regulator [Deltaproteobacteria bacterium]MBT4268854.1 transcriptional regulator [Deltaproteobacteria bacterium]MBT4641828.1 transcriptional regulator [Deltaproteobacteria bacterium]MBT6504569.1 transcriptional regulator [Deltaproteobacteria bacterium]MBT6612183.1 transcriptional regulator [Deltaproteobacteria bacterium]